MRVKVSEVGENAVLTGGLYELKRYVLNNEIVKAAVGDLEL